MTISFWRKYACLLLLQKISLFMENLSKNPLIQSLSKMTLLDRIVI